jgi:hypothetical protein
MASRRRVRNLLVMGAAAVVAGAAAIVLAGPAAAAELVTNGGFEAGNLSSWACTGGTGSVVTSPVRGGSYALAGAATANDNAQCTQTIAVQANTAYALTAWVRGAYVYLGVTGGSSTWTPSATAWTQLTVTFNSGAATSAQIYLHGWYAQGTYYADDVSLSGPGTTPTPSRTTPPSTTAPPQVPPTPTGLAVTASSCNSVPLSWSAASGATSYKVYRATTVAATVTGTSTTVTGLSASTAYTWRVSAVNSAGESAQSAAVNVTTPACPAGGSTRSWPYIDVTATTPTMASVANATGHKYFTTAFVIGSGAGCVPTWGGTIPLTEARIVNDINAIKSSGGDVTVAFGGAVGPYLEHVCTTQASLAGAYRQVIDTLHISRIDVDIEASVNVDLMNKALAQVQRERPGTQISYTLMVQGDDYGLTPQLGVDVLTNAKANGVNVGIVNPMTMEFGSSRPDWGDAVIAAANATLTQMAQIWPEKTDAQRKRMLGVTPMIGRNYNGRVFQLEDGSQLVAWANSNHIGLLAFWSVGRDNGGCPGGGVSATCSSISQSTYQFINIFKSFTG